MAGLALVLGLLVVEGAASVILAWLDRPSGRPIFEEKHCRYDAELGWINLSSREFPNLFGPGKPFTTNARGLRERRELGPAAPAGRRRVVLLGDSFVEGVGVGDAETLPAQLEALDPRIEAVNMGVGGYGLDQCLLWWRREAERLAPELLVLVAIADDFERLNRDSFAGRAKPRLRERDGRLVVGNVPVPEGFGERKSHALRRAAGSSSLGRLFSRILGRHTTDQGELSPAESSALFVKSLPEGPVARAIVRELAASQASRGGGFLMLYLPTRSTLKHEPTAAAAWMRETSKEDAVGFADMTPRFAELSTGAAFGLFLPDGHLTAEGNRMVATGLLADLRERFPAWF